MPDNILKRSTNTRTRGHQLKLEKPACRRNTRLYTFSSRVVNPWNSLPASVVDAPDTKSFEKSLDRAWRDHPLRWDPEHAQIYRVPELDENG